MPENLAELDLPILAELRNDLIGAAQSSERRSIVLIAAHKRHKLMGAGALALIAAVVAVAIGVSLSSSPQPALALPVLGRPATDASSISQRTKELTHLGADFQAAHAISTAYGTGYVMPAAKATKLCLAVPDPVDGYGVACATVQDTHRHGLYSMLLGAHSSEFVAVLPAGAQNPTIQRANGRSESIPLHQDVGVLVLNENATVTLHIGTYRATILVPAQRPLCHHTPGHAGDSRHGHFTRELCKEP